MNGPNCIGSDSVAPLSFVKLRRVSVMQCVHVTERLWHNVEKEKHAENSYFR